MVKSILVSKNINSKIMSYQADKDGKKMRKTRKSVINVNNDKMEIKRIGIDKSKKRFKYIAMSFVSIVLIFGLGISAYFYKLLSLSEHTNIPIVNSLAISEGMLDDVADPNDEENSAGSASHTGSGSSPVALWGIGRVRVYVDSRFPIEKVEPKSNDVENYLIFGVDARSAYETKSRTDSLLVATIDKKNNSIKLTSIMRDTQVKIPGRTNPSKINSAYVFGGIGLLINTINQNFDLDIQKFAMVDMWSAENVINAMGGVNINITSAEIKYINEEVGGSNRRFKNISKPSPLVTKSGNILLDGRQAVSYGRIRKIGNDQGRTLRQRTIMSKAIMKFKSSPLSQKLSVFEELSKSFESNISKSDMMLLAFDVLSSMKNIKQYRVPADNMYTTNTTNWNIIINHDVQNPALHNFIWGNVGGNPIVLPSDAPTVTPVESSQDSSSEESYYSGESSSSLDESSSSDDSFSSDPSSSATGSSSISGATPTVGPTNAVSSSDSTKSKSK